MSVLTSVRRQFPKINLTLDGYIKLIRSLTPTILRSGVRPQVNMVELLELLILCLKTKRALDSSVHIKMVYMVHQTILTIQLVAIWCQDNRLITASIGEQIASASPTKIKTR